MLFPSLHIYCSLFLYYCVSFSFIWFSSFLHFFWFIDPLKSPENKVSIRIRIISSYSLSLFFLSVSVFFNFLYLLGLSWSSLSWEVSSLPNNNKERGTIKENDWNIYLHNGTHKAFDVFHLHFFKILIYFTLKKIVNYNL